MGGGRGAGKCYNVNTDAYKSCLVYSFIQFFFRLRSYVSVLCNLGCPGRRQILGFLQETRRCCCFCMSFAFLYGNTIFMINEDFLKYCFQM